MLKISSLVQLAEWFALNEPADHIKCPNGLVKWQDVSAVSDHDLLEVQNFSGVAGDFLANFPNASISSSVIVDSTLVGPSKMISQILNASYKEKLSQPV